MCIIRHSDGFLTFWHCMSKSSPAHPLVALPSSRMQPGGATKELHSGHAKVIVVDSRAVSIGSQNYYSSSPASTSEFTYIFESESDGSELISNYFVPMEA
jgi:phosphatidylserine/phosphatidylglycerophosphate/cardiolipin synthase-like enzyme